MLGTDIWFLTVAAISVLFAAISKAGFGSGASFASASVLALIVEPAIALGIMLPLLMLIDAASLKPYWKRWSVPDALLLILGGLPGVIAGAALFTIASADLFRLLIGAISICFVLWQVSRRRGWIGLAETRMPDWLGGLFGCLAGFTTFVSHAGGPPAAVFLLTRGLSKTEFQATTVLVFWILNIAKFFPYAALGMFTAETLQINLMLAPIAVVGTMLGVKAHLMVSERVFFGITYTLLLLTGGKLIWDALA